MKKKYYMVLDTETATLPFAKSLCKNPAQLKKVAIARPLVYDIGWTIMERNGNIVERKNFLVQETFFVPSVFNTAYYKEKRPTYIKALKDGTITAKTWNEIAEILLADLGKVDIVAAYNAPFDFKKAIPFTEEYIAALYSDDYNAWEKTQYNICRKIVNGETWQGENPEYLKPAFIFRDGSFPLVDLWNLACEKLINIDKYRDFCLQSKQLTASAQYFKTSAETTFQYLGKQHDFIEEHTALKDAEIESAILAKALKKGKVEPSLDSFPFRKLGTTHDYIRTKRPKYHGIVIDALIEYIQNNDGFTRSDMGETYWVKTCNLLVSLVKEFDYDLEGL